MVPLLKVQILMMKDLAHPAKEEMFGMEGKGSKEEMTARREGKTEVDPEAWKEEDLKAEMIREIEAEEIAVRKIEEQEKGEILVKKKNDQEREEILVEISGVRGRLIQGMNEDLEAEKDEIKEKDQEAMKGRERTIEKTEDKVIELFKLLCSSYSLKITL